MPRKRIAHWGIGCWGIALTLLLFPGRADAVSCIASLKGLEGVEVLVEELKSELENFNITAVQIQSDVETKLREAGIKILSKEENEKAQSQRKPYLYLRITSYKPPGGREVVAFSMDLALKQQVVLAGGPTVPAKPFYAPTWYVGVVGIVGWKNLATVRESASTLTDQFIDAYRSMNAKKGLPPQ
jgi:hypothetical protein